MYVGQMASLARWLTCSFELYLIGTVVCSFSLWEIHLIEYSFIINTVSATMYTQRKVLGHRQLMSPIATTN